MKMSPEGRAKGKIWRVWAAMCAERKRKAELIRRFSPEGRMKGACLRTWCAEAKERKRQLNLVRNFAKRMSPEGRAKNSGLIAFKSRPPAWIPAMCDPSMAESSSFSRDGFWVTHTQHRVRQSVYASPVIRKGVHRFGFRVVGSGMGLVVGVADASSMYGPGEAPAWGLHLTHGAMYTKFAHSDKGELSMKQLLPSPVIDDEEEELMDEDGVLPPRVMDIVVEVDADNRTIAFGLPDTPLILSPIPISDDVRPWAYLWEGGDSLMLDPQPPPRRPKGITTQEWHRAVKKKDRKPVVPNPLRSRRGRPLSPDSPAKQTSALALISGGESSPKKVSSAKGPETASPGRSPGSRSRRWISPYLASPGRTNSLNPFRSQRGKKAGSASEAIILSPRNQGGAQETHMWDVVRRTTGLYSDTFSQL
uniref:SPRY domain-containing protein n=1 Tax=Haptolina ericina TaxID=156174 RepID=A0A7S3F2T1_9EUKA